MLTNTHRGYIIALMTEYGTKIIKNKAYKDNIKHIKINNTVEKNEVY